MYPFLGSHAASTAPTVEGPLDDHQGDLETSFGESLAVGARRTYDRSSFNLARLTHGTSRSNGCRKHRVAQPDQCAWPDRPSPTRERIAIALAIENDSDLRSKRDLLLSISGVGDTLAGIVLAELPGPNVLHTDHLTRLVQDFMDKHPQ